MSVRIKVDIPITKIIRKSGVKNEAQRFFTHEVRRLCDPYVPKRAGVLKNTAIENKDSITYNQVYARRQYYEHKGDGLRGSHWEKRMMAQRGPALLNGVARFIKRRMT